MYKIVAADVRAPRDGKFIEAIGHYNPLTNPRTLVVDEERALYWLKVGAKPTDTVRDLLSQAGVLYRLHLERKGKSEEEIQQLLTEWKQQKEQALVSKVNKKQLRKERKKAEAAKQDSAEDETAEAASEATEAVAETAEPEAAKESSEPGESA